MCNNSAMMNAMMFVNAGTAVVPFISCDATLWMDFNQTSSLFSCSLLSVSTDAGLADPKVVLSMT